MNDIPIFTEEEFLSACNASRQDIGDSALHKNRGTHSNKMWRKIIHIQALKDHELIILRGELRQWYINLCKLGNIRKPTIKESLIKTANGHPDNKATQAAKRLLKRINERNNHGANHGRYGKTSAEDAHKSGD